MLGGTCLLLLRSGTTDPVDDYPDSDNDHRDGAYDRPNRPAAIISKLKSFR